jgi:hypothetical protein
MSGTSASHETAPAPQAVLFAIDEDPGPRMRCGMTCPVGSARNPHRLRVVADAGLAALRELAVRCVPVALLIVGQELSGMRGLPSSAAPMRCTRWPCGYC